LRLLLPEVFGLDKNGGRKLKTKNIQNRQHLQMEKPNFSKLYEQSLQLTSHIENDGFLLQRNVEQLDQTSKKLVSKASKVSGDIAKNKAYELFICFLYCS
jgi:hypothetical protein